MNKLMMLPLVTLTVACGGFEPLEGEWTTTSETIVDDGCDFGGGDDGGDEGDEAQAATSTLTLNDDGTFLLVPGDFPVEFNGWTCTLDDHDFACDAFSWDDDLGEMSGGTLEGTVTTSIDVAGVFSDETHGDAGWTLSMDCQGTGCEAASLAACTTSVASTIENSAE